MAKGWERAVGWGACAVSIALLVVALIASRVEAATVLRADNAVVALAAVPGRPAAGYLNLSGGPATLTGVASPLAKRVEMHSSSMAGGVMSMDKLAAVLVRADHPASFSPRRQPPDDLRPAGVGEARLDRAAAAQLCRWPDAEGRGSRCRPGHGYGDA